MTRKGNFHLMLAAFTLCFLFMGCATGVPEKPPMAEGRIHALNSMGKQAFERADYAGAYNFYSRALEGAMSIEKPSSIAINAINAAAALRGAGKFEEAARVLDILLVESPISYDAAYLSKASYLRAAMLMDVGNAAEAQVWAEKSINYCRQSACDAPYGVNVVMARLALMGGDAGGALAYAKRVSGKAAESEKANAMRMMGDARILMGMPEKALAHYDAALQIDKAQALSGRIGMDLMGAGRALEAMGQPELALERYRRVLSLAKAAGNAPMVSEAIGAIESLGIADR